MYQLLLRNSLTNKTVIEIRIETVIEIRDKIIIKVLKYYENQINNLNRKFLDTKLSDMIHCIEIITFRFQHQMFA